MLSAEERENIITITNLVRTFGKRPSKEKIMPLIPSCIAPIVRNITNIESWNGATLGRYVIIACLYEDPTQAFSYILNERLNTYGSRSDIFRLLDVSKNFAGDRFESLPLTLLTTLVQEIKRDRGVGEPHDGLTQRQAIKRRIHDDEEGLHS
ncbi:MAG: hypothetical protein AAB407_00240 [Patescibacteria group bacterium]|mgnify:CR=1 FL=1